MKSSYRYLFFLTWIAAMMACQNKKTSGEEWVSFRRMDNYALPQQVIGFFYEVDTRQTPKTLNDPEQKYRFVDSFIRVSHVTETHYTITINQTPLQIRERDFMPPFLLFRGRLYYTKTRIQFGKLQTPQELMIYSAPLDSLLMK